MLAERQARVEQANALIVAIGSHGRRFFWSTSKERFARFEISERGRVLFVDDYIGKPTDTHNETGRWPNFSHGGTLKALVCAVRDFIVTGKPINPRYLGPWPKHLCDGDLWGYGHGAMEAVRAQADLTGVLGPRPEPKTAEVKAVEAKAPEAAEPATDEPEEEVPRPRM